MLYTQSCLTDIYQIKCLYIKTHSDRFSYMVKKFIKSLIFSWMWLQMPVILTLGNGGKFRSSRSFLATQRIEANLTT